MRITKRIREEAAHICALAASGRAFGTYVEDAAEWLNLTNNTIRFEDCPPSMTLAFLAVTNVEKHAPHGYGWHRANYAEAEAMLRTGWKP